MEKATAQMLPDGRRLHLHHGPIDLIIEVTGKGREPAFRAATARFQTVLEELAPQLSQLRLPIGRRPTVTGTIARRMIQAVEPFIPDFVTPMAAVAGSVADEILGEIARCSHIQKAYVNNGGDVSIHLTQGQTMVAAMAGLPGGKITLFCDDPFRGVATSARHGRSHSLGIADNVTVLAVNAASADAAATLIANAVDLPGHPAIKRVPACTLSPDSDLGERLVTQAVGPLSAVEKKTALQAGVDRASQMLAKGLIGAAALSLGDQHRFVGLDENPIRLKESELRYG